MRGSELHFGHCVVAVSHIPAVLRCTLFSAELVSPAFLGAPQTCLCEPLPLRGLLSGSWGSLVLQLFFLKRVLVQTGVILNTLLSLLPLLSRAELADYVHVSALLSSCAVAENCLCGLPLACGPPGSRVAHALLWLLGLSLECCRPALMRAFPEHLLSRLSCPRTCSRSPSCSFGSLAFCLLLPVPPSHCLCSWISEPAYPPSCPARLLP